MRGEALSERVSGVARDVVFLVDGGLRSARARPSTVRARALRRTSSVVDLDTC